MEKAKRLDTCINKIKTSNKALLTSMDTLSNLLLKVQTSIEPISSMTEQLKKGERNLYSCQQYVKELIDLNAELRQTADFLNKRLLNVEFDLYLKMLRKAQDLKSKLTKNSGLPNQEQLLKNIDESIEVGIYTCEQTLEQLFLEFNRATAEEGAASQSVFEQAQGIPAPKHEQRKIAHKINAVSRALLYSKNGIYHRKYFKIRIPLIEDKIKALNKVSMSLASGYKTPQFYQKGSHPFIKVFPSLTQLMHSESKYFKMLFKDTGNQEELALQLIQPIMQYIKGEIQIIIDSNFENYYDALTLCDVYENSANHLEPLLEAQKEEALQSLRVSIGFSEIQTLLEKGVVRTQRFICSLSSKLFNQEKSSLTLNQNIDPQVTGFVTFLKSLSEYPRAYSVIQSVNSHSKHKFKSKELLTVVGELVVNICELVKRKARSIKIPVIQILYQVNNIAFLLDKLVKCPKEFMAFQLLEKIDNSIDPLLSEYLKLTWDKLIVTCLSDTPSVIAFQKPNVLKESSKKAIKRKCKEFNSEFTQIVKQQSRLNVFDPDIRIAMQEKSRYSGFVSRYKDLDFAPNKDKYLYYSEKQVSSMLGSILQGSS